MRNNCRVKPDIVYVSGCQDMAIPARNHPYTTFDPVAQAVSGTDVALGPARCAAAGWGWSYMDDTGGMYGAMCVLTGLIIAT